MKLRLILLLALIVTLGACNFSSLHPLYTKDSLIMRDDLLGNWINAEEDQDQNHWFFKKLSEDKMPGYYLTFTDKESKTEQGDTATYEVHLVKLDNYYFLDFKRDFTDQEEAKLGDILAPVLETHSFAKLEIEKERIILRFFDYDFLKNLFEQQKIRLKHERLEDDSIVLTAPTEDLQKFVIKYADVEKAYQDPIVLKRKEI